MTRRQLSARLRELGHPIDTTTIEKIETGRKKTVSLDSVFAIAVALDVSPLFLLLPYQEGEQVAAAPNAEPDTIWTLELWLRGDDPLTGQDRARFYRELPPHRFEKVRDAALGLYHGQLVPPGAVDLRNAMLEAGEAPPVEWAETTPDWLTVLNLSDEEAREVAREKLGAAELEAADAEYGRDSAGVLRQVLFRRALATAALRQQMAAAADELGLPRKTGSRRKEAQ